MKNLFVLAGVIKVTGEFKKPVNKDVVTENYIRLTVKWEKLTPAKKIEDAKLKKSLCTGNADLPVIPWPTQFVALAKLGTDIVDADAKLLLRSQKMPNSRQNLSVGVKLLYKDVKSIGALIQTIMDAAPSNDEAIRICTGCGYTYTISKGRPPRKNSVAKSTVPGELLVEAEGDGMHQWQMTADPNFVDTVNLDPTTDGTYEKGNLISGKQYWFRWRLVLPRHKYGKWCDWYDGFAP